MSARSYERSREREHRQNDKMSRAALERQAEALSPLTFRPLALRRRAFGGRDDMGKRQSDARLYRAIMQSRMIDVDAATPSAFASINA